MTRALGPGPDSQPRPGTHGPVLTVRPRRIAYYGGVAAAIVLGTMIVVGVLLRSSDDGITFRVTDQVAMIGVGILAAGAIMLVARPRLRADAAGMWVRNILGETYFPWQAVVRIAFPEGGHWAQVVLASEENHPLMAIQALDRERAVEALHAVRELREANAPPPPAPSPQAVERARRRAQAEAAAAAARPLGRLEIIDRERAAAPPRRRRRRSPRGD